MIQKQKNEIVFSQKEVIELYIMRTLKRDNDIVSDILIKNIKSKYDVDIKIINDTLEKLVDNEYLKYENNKYLYVI